MAVYTVEQLRAMMQLQLGVPESQLPIEGMLQYLNMAQAAFAADTGGIDTIIKRDLVADTEEYTLPDTTLQVHRVQVYDANGKMVNELRGVSRRGTKTLVNNLASSTPAIFSFSPQQVYDSVSGITSPRAVPVLRIQPASSVAVTEGLLVYAIREPITLTTESSSVDFGTGAGGLAIVAMACAQATADPNKYQMFLDKYARLKATYNRSRGVKRPVPVRAPVFDHGHQEVGR